MWLEQSERGGRLVGPVGHGGDLFLFVFSLFVIRNLDHLRFVSHLATDVYHHKPPAQAPPFFLLCLNTRISPWMPSG